MNDVYKEEKKRLYLIVSVLGALLALFVAIKSLSEWRSYRHESVASYGPTIEVSGEGEVMAVPDTATFGYTVEARAKSVADAQKQVSAATEKILDYLKKNGVDTKDIKTDSYSAYPEYEYQELTRVECFSYPCPPSGKQVLVGYIASQSTQVKVRELEKAGTLVDGVGSLGATNISGVNFIIDEEDDLKREARQEAVALAKKKAQELAKDLGVSLVRIVGYSENGNSPIYYGREAAFDMKASAGSASPVPATSFSPGENKITSYITLIYEIR